VKYPNNEYLVRPNFIAKNEPVVAKADSGLSLVLADGHA
jgi:hypothetical protein